ncbi:MAG: hypothetical protein JWO70_1005 [Betaproteobacteria bacterium]|nr:hypothetical protein [Betaproteobacteria bacterium]
MIVFVRRAALAAALFIFAFAAAAQVPVPALTVRVTDQTGTLTAEQRTALEERLAAFESRKGAQIAVLIVSSTQPEAIEQFAIRVAEQWKVGRKGVDDGAILVVAVKDRALRIEVGYGLEGALPDAVAKRIIAEDIVPHFKQNDFYGGINAGVSRMISVVEGEALPAPRSAQGGKGNGGGFEGLLVIGFMLVFVVGGIVRAIFGRFLGSGVIGAIGGVAGWLMLGSIAMGVVVALVAAFLSLMGGAGGAGRRGGWSSGGLPGGGWGGGGGSWGGGGGGFGGGGASGRW